MIRYRFWSRVLNELVRKRLKHISGIRNVPAGSFILAANHIDWLDGLLLISSLFEKLGRRRLYFVSRTSNWWLFGNPTVQIDLNRPSEILSRTRQLTSQGHVICFFVEGARNSSSTLLRGKTGCARLALTTGLPVVPVGLIGKSYSTFERSLLKLPETVNTFKISFGKSLRWSAVKPNQLTPRLLDVRTRVIMKAISRLCHKKSPY